MFGQGFFNFEIGVQSTYERTLKEIHRYVDFSKLEDVCKRIKSYRNIHLHLDLIAGLPYESYDRFLKSFDDVYAIRPEMLQLGFFKAPKGVWFKKKKR